MDHNEGGRDGASIPSEHSSTAATTSELRKIFKPLSTATKNQQQQFAGISLITNTQQNSPISPEFDAISTLPTPVMSEGSPRSSSPKRKSYGLLQTRPSILETIGDEQARGTRTLSEFGAVTPQDRFTRDMRHTLDPKGKGTHRSPQRRNISTSFKVESNNDLEREAAYQTIDDPQPRKLPTSTVYACTDKAGVRRHWGQVRALGKGTFSTVVLGSSIDDDCPKELQRVAIKVVVLPQHRDSHKRIESSLRRELEILRVMNHPCVTRLLATDVGPDRQCLVTPLCEGGDLFELAASHRKELSALLIRRIFAEAAVAVAYLHKNNVVHRDIKLENVLINVPISELLKMDRFGMAPTITLTDFGLSRIIDPNEPFLVTRCGSEDYVPPELLIGLPYDGRQTDSWALGVLLYAVMESRLPFDPPPSKSIRARSRVAHRIARIEWEWSAFAEDSVEPWSHQDWGGAKWIVDNLLVRREKRLTTDEVAKSSWVKDVLPDEFYAF